MWRGKAFPSTRVGKAHRRGVCASLGVPIFICVTDGTGFRLTLPRRLAADTGSDRPQTTESLAVLASHEMHLVRIGFQLAAALVTLGLLVVNAHLYSPGSAKYGPDQLGEDIVPQLTFIGAALREGEGERMQGLFPEGFFFSHILYGLAWVEVGLRVPQGSSLHGQAIQQASWALSRLDTTEARAPFRSNMDPPYGAFYVGWTNWLRGGVLMLLPEDRRPSAEIDRFEADSVGLALAFDRSPTPFLPAYPGRAWPVDSVVAIASLRLHDAILPPRFSETVERWVGAAQDRLDPITGLLPHRSDPLTGEPLEGARGSSQSLIARFLPEVDPEWGRTQYASFRREFVGSFLGIPGVREYSAGRSGSGDIDTGPLFAGFSPSASVVMVAAAQVNGDRELADAFIDVSEALGLPVRWGNTKRYALGILPVGDAFLVWAKTSRPWVAEWTPAVLPRVVPPSWRVPLQAATLVVVGGMWALSRRFRN